MAASVGTSGPAAFSVEPAHDEMASTQTSEAARLAAVRRYDILDTPPDGAFDRVAALAARLLDVPVATVTIVDEDRIWFKATHGLDGVTQIGRDPGLCASAITSDEALVIPDTLADPVASANPLVTGPMGVRFYAAAPIVTADGHGLGTVNVLDTRSRLITGAEIATLTDLAAVVMDQLELRLSALRAIRAERQRRREAEHDRAALATFAATLQRTLLPPALPVVPGLELACHYHTASPERVGGDFYDVFPIGVDQWGFFLGAVCGHGAPAAALTSLTRYTLRAAAHNDPSPQAALQALNTVLLEDPAAGTRFCTAIYGLLRPTGDGGFVVAMAAGGHPPAYHLTLDESGHARASAVDTTGGMLIGALPDARFVTATVQLAPGEALLLYTDGLTEARTRSGELLDDEGLVGFLTSRAGPVGATALVADTAGLLEALPGVTDDAALLALSVPTPDAGDAG